MKCRIPASTSATGLSRSRVARSSGATRVSISAGSRLGVIPGNQVELMLASVLPQGGDALADADTHGGRRPASAAPAQFVQQGGGDAGAGAAEWVADGDRAAVDVQPV